MIKLILKEQLKRAPFVRYCNGLIKARLQENEVSQEDAYYKKIASVKNINLLNYDKLICKLREKLVHRGTSNRCMKKGELHIFLIYSLDNWERVLPRALRFFGKVTEYECQSRGFTYQNLRELAQRSQMNEEMLEVFHRAHQEHPIDVVIGYLSGYNTAPETLEKMRLAGSIIFNFCWDDKLKFRGDKINGRWNGPVALVSAVDLNLTNSPISCIKYMVEGGLAMFWPEAADPDFHKPYDIPFEFDVSFVGQKYGWRPKFIDSLRRKGINVVTFGNGWENGPLPDDEMVKLYSRSRINLGFAGIGHSKKLMCLKGRDFEVPMSGGLYLTQDNPELSLVYEVDKEIVTYRDEGDCTAKIKWLLNNPDEAEKIRRAGRDRALRDHSWDLRFEHIFKMAGLI